jgi:hypothetical protein
MYSLTISLLFLSLTSLQTSPCEVRTAATVIAENVSLRLTPTEDALKIKDLPLGAAVKILDQDGAWYIVRVADRVGWLYRSTVSLSGASIKDSVPRTEQSVVPLSVPAASSIGAYTTGPRGGCYYVNSKGKKVYVDHSKCN